MWDLSRTGRLPKGAVESLKGLGAWLKVYGEAIYGTRVCAPYQAGNIAFTKKGETVYALELFEDENQTVPEEVLIPYEGPVAKVTLLGSEAAAEFERRGEGIAVKPPVWEEKAAPIARVYRLEKMRRRRRI